MNTIPVEQQNFCSAFDNIHYQLEEYLAAVRKETGIPGICLALNIGGNSLTISSGTISADSTEPVDGNTRFRLGCISKVLTALTAADLITAGKIGPDDPVGKYLPELSGTSRGENLLIWHLLSHTSGYRGLDITDPGVAFYYSWSRFLEYFRSAPQMFMPGSVFSYEHSEYVILGEIIQRVSPADIFDLYKEMIFDPLNLFEDSVSKKQRGEGVYAADHIFDPDTMRFKKIKAIPFGDFWKASLNSITMNMSDLLCIASAVCGISKIPGISEKTLGLVKKQVVKLPRTYGGARHEQVPVTFGIGCASYRGWLSGHNGSSRGQTCGLRFDPNSNTALVIGINAWQPFIRDSIINQAFELLRGRPIPSLPEEPMEFPLNDLTGTYIGPQGFEINVSYENERLICKSNNRRLAAIILQRDEEGILRACSDTKHHSLGFFNEPGSGIQGLMLGMSAFRKQYPF